MKFEELKLAYGYPFQLQTSNLPGQFERFSSRLIGCLPGRSLLLSVPKQAGKLVRFRNGQKIVVRLMIDNGIGIFACVVESLTFDPYPVLHLTYPESVTFKGIRSTTRVAVHEQVSVANISADSKPVTRGIISDISISGARIELEQEIAAVGDALEIHAVVAIREISRELVLIAKVRSIVDSVENPSDDTLTSYGLEFMRQEGDQRLLLYAYVFNQMALQEYPAG